MADRYIYIERIRRNRALSGIIFASFVLGSILSVCSVYFAWVPAEGRLSSWHVLISAIPSVAALILSSSLLGVILLPVCSFLYGLMLTWLACGALLGDCFGLWLVTPQLLALPVFFVSAAMGMDNSAVLCGTFFRSSERVRGIWSRQFAITLMSVALVLFTAHLLMPT